jgi:hypothetical protein
VFPVARPLPSTLSAADDSALLEGFAGVGSEEARSVSLALASVRLPNRTCSFPASGFHEDALRCDAIEGMSAIKLTKPSSP